MLALSGSAHNSNMSVRALGFIIAGHQIHHLNIFNSDIYNNYKDSAFHLE